MIGGTNPGDGRLQQNLSSEICIPRLSRRFQKFSFTEIVDSLCQRFAEHSAYVES